MPPLYIVLLHHPIINKNGRLITTSVTNLDIHDLSRTARTYGARKIFLVTPLQDQQELIGRILKHWLSSDAKEESPDRYEALSLIEVVPDFEAVKAQVGPDAHVVVTDARKKDGAVTCQEFRKNLSNPLATTFTRPILLVFGTGWGIAESFYEEVDTILSPVYGPGGEGSYNHLSVRAAASAVLDRIYGTE